MISATKMNQIALRKKTTLEQLNALRKNYIITIYRGICKEKSVREIHKELIEDTIFNIEHKYAIDNNMLKYAKKLTNECKNIAKNNKNDVILFAPLVFSLLTNTKTTDTMFKMSHDNARKYEAELKNNMITLELEHNRELETPKVFYVASKHVDCAEDHKDYQGKVYVDEKWQSLIVDKVVKEKVKRYIKLNNIKTFQWVIGKPAWLITRPNCRHFFKALDTLAVLNNSVDSLREIYNLNRIVGDRQLTQTIHHLTTQEWYTKTNVSNIIRQYEDRLNLHKRMKQEHDNIKIDFAINKDKLLINKWKQYYNLHFTK